MCRGRYLSSNCASPAELCLLLASSSGRDAGDAYYSRQEEKERDYLSLNVRFKSAQPITLSNGGEQT